MTSKTTTGRLSATHRSETVHLRDRVARTNALWFDLETTLMDQVQRLDGVPALYDTGNIDLARALTDHLNVDIALGEGLKHPSRHAHQLAHLLSDEGEDGHVVVHRDLSDG